jgi:hypothetical protein
MTVAPLLVVMVVVGQGCQSAPPAPPRDYYFSPRGDDAAGTGTPERPYRTIAKASALELNPGDRVLFEAGQTFAGNLALDARDAGTPERPVTIGSYGPGRATFEAGRATGVRVENAGGVRVADLVVLGAGPRYNRGSGVEFVNTLTGGKKLRHVRVENVEASGFGREGVLVHGAPDDGSPSGYDDVLVADCALRENLHTGIYFTGWWKAERGRQPHAFAHSNVRVVRCLAEGNPGDPTARNTNRSGSGILLDSVDGAVVEHCEATNNGAENYAHHGGPVGIWCTIANNVTIQYSKSHRNRTANGHDGGGFCLDGGVCNSVLQYNATEENEGSGYGIYEYPGAPPAFGNVIRHNVSRNDGRKNGYAGIHVWDDARTLHNVRIEGNNVYMDPAPPGRKPPRGMWIQSPIRDCRIAGNTFTVMPGVRLMDVAGGQRGVRFERNTYHTGGDRVALEWEGREYTSLIAWLAASGQPVAERHAGAE